MHSMNAIKKPREGVMVVINKSRSLKVSEEMLEYPWRQPTLQALLLGWSDTATAHNYCLNFV